MTNDSKLFPPRPKWEEWGYRPDEYSRWIKGPWKPIAELWAELGVNPSRPRPVEVELPDWAFDAAATAEERAATSLRLGGVTIRPGDVARTDWRVRCAQPPYDTLPIPRADIPAGIILSRDADAWLREDEIPIVTFTDANDRPLKIKVEKIVNGKEKKVEIEVRGPAIALPLYEGRMIGQFDFSEKGWVSGKGRSAEWRDIEWERKNIEPQYLMGMAVSRMTVPVGLKLPIMNIGSATNRRTIYGALISDAPCNHSLNPMRTQYADYLPSLCGVLNSMFFDAQVRLRLTGLNISFFILDEIAVIGASQGQAIGPLARPVSLASTQFAADWIRSSTSDSERAFRQQWALTNHERLRRRVSLEPTTASLMGLDRDDARVVLQGGDLPCGQLSDGQVARRLNAKGFWRIDKDKHPEHRLTVLSLIAFHDLQEKIAACDGDVSAGIEAFCNQNDGEGWLLPETLRLADFRLGHDDRAEQPQPVRSCFGPRFYDWQLTQTAEESWRECRLHARNLLGEEGYIALLRQIERGEDCEEENEHPADDEASCAGNVPAGRLFDE